jgi:hypothetical protein
VAQQPNRQDLLLAVSLINDAVVANSELEKARERTGQGFGINRIKVSGEPAKFSQDTISRGSIEFLKVLRRLGAEFDLIHLPFQAPSAGHLSRRQVFALRLSFLKVTAKALSDLRTKLQPRVGINQYVAQLFLHHFSDHRLELLDGKVLDRLHNPSLWGLYTRKSLDPKLSGPCVHGHPKAVPSLGVEGFGQAPVKHPVPSHRSEPVVQSLVPQRPCGTDPERTAESAETGLCATCSYYATIMAPARKPHGARIVPWLPLGGIQHHLEIEMSKRWADVEALLNRSKGDFEKIETEYNASLHAQTIAADLRIDIKNLFGNLRSVLDYIAQDIREIHCSPLKPKEVIYFPILPDLATFDRKVDRWFPGLRTTEAALTTYLETIQPYHNGNEWLAHFNTVNNESKHQGLVAQTRAEYAETRVTRPGAGQARWGPGVKFGSGVSVLGVAIDPRTQLPVANSGIRVDQITWVDFRFEGIDVSALVLLKSSEGGIQQIARTISKWL